MIPKEVATRSREITNEKLKLLREVVERKTEAMTNSTEPLVADPTAEEARAIRALQRLAKRWPKSLWLFSASGSLNVMRANRDGDRAHVSGGGMDPAYSLATINIPNDGGDW